MPWMGYLGKGFSAVMLFNSLKSMAEMIQTLSIQDETAKYIITPCRVLRVTEIISSFPECLYGVERTEPDPEREASSAKKSGPEVIPSEEELFPDELVQWTEVMEEEDEEVFGEDGLMPEPVEPKKLLREGPPKPSSVTYFKELDFDKLGILRASTHQCDPSFTRYMGKQSIANATSAICMLRQLKSRYWTQNTVNQILKVAEQIHHDTKKPLEYGETITPVKLCKKVCIGDSCYTPVAEDYTIIGQLQSNQPELLDLLPALQEAFRLSDGFILTGPITLAVWQEDGVYYMYDPNERDLKGAAIIKEIQRGSETIFLEWTPGYACVIWFKYLEDLVSLYINNVPRLERRSGFILSKIEVEDYVEPPEDWYNFSALNKSKWILRATMAQSNVRFSKESRNTQCTANAVMAIIFANIYPMNKWTADTMDKV